MDSTQIFLWGGAHDTNFLPPPVSLQPFQSSLWDGGTGFLSLFSHFPAPTGAPHPFASSWQDWVQRSNPPNVMGLGAYGNAMGVNNVGYGMRPQSSPSSMHGRSGMNMNGGMGGMDAPQNLMPWAAASQSFSAHHLPNPVLPPHASLSERRDYLLGASLPHPPFVEDINFMVPLIPPSAMSFNERLRHKLDLENRFCPPQQSKVCNATLKAESGGPLDPIWPIKLSRPEVLAVPPREQQLRDTLGDDDRPNYIPITREPLHDAVVKWDHSGAVEWATTASHIEERDADMRNHIQNIVATIKSAFDPKGHETGGAAKVLKDVNIQTDLQSSTIEYLDQVKLAFGNNPEIYSKFLDIMKDYRASVINTQQVIESVGCLFHGHQLLVQGLAGFLPHIQTERQRQQELLQLPDMELKSQWVTAQDKSLGPSSTPNPTHPSSTLQPTSTSRGLQSTPIWPLSPPRKNSEKEASPSFDKSLGSLGHTVDTVARFLDVESVLQSQEVSPEDLLLKVDGLDISQMTSRQVHTILKLDDLYSVVELTLQRRRSGELYTLKVRRDETKKPQHFAQPMTLHTIDDSIAEDNTDNSKKPQHFLQPMALATIVDSIAEEKLAGADKQNTQKPELQDVVAAPESLAYFNDDHKPAYKNPTTTSRLQRPVASGLLWQQWRCDLTVNDIQKKVKNAEASGIEAVIAGMEAHKASALLQEQACAALRKLAHNIDNKVTIGHAGGIGAVVAAMGAHKGSAGVQEWACAVLGSLACNDDNKLKIAAAGGIGAVVGAIVANKNSARVQEQACAALGNLAHNNANNKVKIAAAGGIGAVVAAMEAHKASARVQQQACAALSNLAANNADNKVTIAEAGGIEALIEAMAGHEGSASVQQQACGALNHLAGKASLRQRIKTAGGEERAKAAVSASNAAADTKTWGKALQAKLT